MNKKNFKIINNKKTAITLGASTIAVVCIIVFFSLMNGTTTTTGNYPDNVSDESLSCHKDNYLYPVFKYDNALRKELEINLLFSHQQISSASLVHKLYYQDVSSVEGSEAHNHAAMNSSFGKNGLGADAFNATYHRLEDNLQMNLFANSQDIKADSFSKYFLFDDAKRDLNTIEDFEDFYTKQGFSCSHKK